ncbi:hypothetical protein I3843_04G184900 [Carya illinoinensis]|nr:hypothetical protein I3843_04G184900 [Carya illinoinensis]
MGRESGDPNTIARPSIALLQERFGHLEKLKERREEKELLKQPSKLPFQPERMIPHYRSNDVQDSLSMGLNMQRNQANV